MPGTQSSHETQSENHQKPEPKQAVDATQEAVSSLTAPALAPQPGRLNPAGVRALQRIVGNRAVSQLLERGRRQPCPDPTGDLAQPGWIHRQIHPLLQRAEEAGTTQEAIALATTGPLKLLSDELAKPSPVAADILTYISQLGPGQRQIVQADEGTGGILDKLAKCAALSNANMLAAIELLDGPIAWSLKWINHKTGAAAAMDDSAIFRLIRSATQAQVEELLKSPTAAGVLYPNFRGNPIDLLAPIIGAGNIAKYISVSAPFMNWVLQRAGETSLLLYFGANSPETLIKALKIRKKWAEFLTALPVGAAMAQAELSALRALFDASKDGGDRAKIFEKRFGVKETHTVEEWNSQGAAYWTAQEGKENVPALGKPSPGGDKQEVVPGDLTKIESLLKELHKKPPDLNICWNLFNSIPRSELAQLRSDDFFLRDFPWVLMDHTSKVIQALARLEYTEPLKAIKFIKNANEQNSIDKKIYRRELFRTDVDGLLNLMADNYYYGIAKIDSNVNPLTIPCVATNRGALAKLIMEQPRFSEWVIYTVGVDTYLQYLGQHLPAYLGRPLIQALLDKLPGGFGLSPKSQDAMFSLFKAVPDMDAKKDLLKRRFELDDVSQEGKKNWTKASLERMWQLISRLPPTLINGAFKELTRGSGDTGEAGFSGEANHAGRTKLSFDTTKMDKLETGQFTSSGDKMGGHKIFDAGAIHEIGHTVDYKHAFSSVGTLLQTDNDLGAWKEYNPTNSGDPVKTALYNQLLADSGDPVGSWPQIDQEITKMILTEAISNHKKPAEISPVVVKRQNNRAIKNAIRTAFKNKIKQLKMTKIINEYGDEKQEPWNRNYNDPVNGRAYHRAYPNEWVSYLVAARGASKLSNYQFRNHREYFAELFATFYLTPDDPGKIIKEWNPKVYNWFVANVDQGYSTRKKTTKGGV